MDDNALKDLPASIDYVLQRTGYSNLNMVSMSKGGYVSLALLSTKPEYNKKVRLHYTMVPVNAVTEPRGWFNSFTKFHRYMVGTVSVHTSSFSSPTSKDSFSLDITVMFGVMD